MDWDPRHLYRQLFPGDEAGMEQFLAGVCTNEWNLQQDAGRSWAEATARAPEAHDIPPIPQAEALAWSAGGGGLYATGEFSPAPLFYLVPRQ